MIGPTAAPQPWIKRGRRLSPDAPPTKDFSSGNRATIDAIASTETPRTLTRSPSILTTSTAVEGAMSNRSAMLLSLCRRGFVADSPDAKVAGSALHHLGLEFDQCEVVGVCDEREIAGRHERDCGQEVDLLANIVGANHLDVTDELGLRQAGQGDVAIAIGARRGKREHGEVLPGYLVERDLDGCADLGDGGEVLGLDAFAGREVLLLRDRRRIDELRRIAEIREGRSADLLEAGDTLADVIVRDIR